MGDRVGHGRLRRDGRGADDDRSWRVLLDLQIVIQGADAPSYTFGTSSTQILPLRNNGEIRIAAEVATDQRIAAVTAAGIGTRGNATEKGYITFRNNSTQGAVLRHFEVAMVRKALGLTAQWVETQVSYYGTGDFEIGGKCRNWSGEPPSSLYYLCFRNTSRVTVVSVTDISKIKGIDVYTEGASVEIAENAIFGVGDNGGGNFSINVDFEISGLGTLKHTTPNKNIGIDVVKNKRLTISCPFESTSRFTFASKWGSSNGTILLTNENNEISPTDYVGLTRNVTLELASEAAGGVTPYRFAYETDLSTLAYLGSGDTSVRTLILGATQGGVLAQRGTGVWTITGPIRQEVDSSTLVLAGDAVAEGVFGEPFASTKDGAAATLNLIKRDTGTWRLTADSSSNPGTTTIEAGTLVLDAGATLPAGAVTLKGGTLEPRDSVSLPAVTATAGQTTLRVADGVTVTLAAFAATSGTLNVIPSGSGAVRVSSGTATGLLFKGVPAAIKDGQVVPSADFVIAARGDVVPQADGQSVVIATAGTSGNDTLAADETTVGSLTQLSDTPATVAIGNEQKLVADSVSIGNDSAELTVGETAGQGTLAAPADGSLTIANGTEDVALTVNAALDASVAVPESAGTVALAGGTVTAKDIAVGNARTVLRDGAFQFDDFALGTGVAGGVSEMLVTNASVWTANPANTLYVGRVGETVPTLNPSPLPPVARLTVADATWVSALVTNTALLTAGGSQGDFTGAFCVGWGGRGVLEIRDGAVITNRLAVGGSSAHDGMTEAFSRGAVYQYGGEMTALGCDKSHYDYGSRIGGYRYASGYYELQDGAFTSLGTLSVGTYVPGIFAQYGGTSVFKKSLDGTSTVSLLALGAANGGAGTVHVNGGTMTINGNGKISLSGGSTGATANLTVSGSGQIIVGGDAFDVNTGTSGASSKSFVNVLDGGTLSYGYIGAVRGLLNVYSDGGVLRLQGYNRYIFSRDGRSTSYPVSHVYVGPKGLTIDTQGVYYGNTNNVPLEAPVSEPGKGSVVGIKGFTPISGRMMEPYCQITGDGEGASAYAAFDSRTGMITNIVITSPGVNYTTATLWVFEGNTTDWMQTYRTSYECEIGEVASGPFTKTGAQDFTFATANTYGGATILKAGTLKLAAAGALPAGSTVSYEGGKLTSTAAACPDAIRFTVPGATKIPKRHALLTFSGEAPATLPTVTYVDAEGKEYECNVFLDGKTLRASAKSGLGMLLLVR